MGAVGYGGLVVADENYELPILDGTFSRSWKGWSKLYDYLVEAEESTPTDPVIGLQTFKEPDGTEWTRQANGLWKVTGVSKDGTRSLGDIASPSDLRGRAGELYVKGQVVGGVTDKQENVLYAILDEAGKLTLYVDAPKGSTIKGYQLFDIAMNHFGTEHIKSIQGIWKYGTNLDYVNEQLKLGVKLETAVKGAWTSGQAARYGFTNIEIESKSEVEADTTIPQEKTDTTIPQYDRLVIRFRRT